MTEYLYCSRCRRPAPPELNGPPDAPSHDWTSWESLTVEGGEDVLVCPGCLTPANHRDIAEGLEGD